MDYKEIDQALYDECFEFSSVEEYIEQVFELGYKTRYDEESKGALEKEREDIKALAERSIEEAKKSLEDGYIIDKIAPKILDTIITALLGARVDNNINETIEFWKNKSQEDIFNMIKK